MGPTNHQLMIIRERARRVAGEGIPVGSDSSFGRVVALEAPPLHRKWYLAGGEYTEEGRA